MKKKTKYSIKSKYLLIIITLFCFVMIFLSFVTDITVGPLKTASNFLILPLQNGINSIGEWVTDQTDYFRDHNDLVNENRALKEQVEELTATNNILVQDKYELERLRDLFDLSENFADYPKVAAKIVSKEPGNWYYRFKIDKGSNDGLAVGMNVISANGNGLVGIITEVTSDYATVRAIIDDVSEVSAMVQATLDKCVVSGDLQLIDSGRIRLTGLKDPDDEVQEGYQIVTSDISSKYLEGILIGYVTELSDDANNLTKSGYLVPAVDFGHLSEVLIITELKEVDE